ncbi:hypothetical protein FHX74_000848 [Friedmanniella endophytica]|uniref:GH26 domain-containing protein n=1 Tax=Microlunatus kandeliicorticis TaxID=1759536 RepID=A0A7W3IQB2_9ACTN|nr:hypothetical protein [Microlunatus kandeliicorticis]MBA8793254.1 hypothetical protein [Microlunatus kandeliicorticis]
MPSLAPVSLPTPGLRIRRIARRSVYASVVTALLAGTALTAAPSAEAAARTVVVNKSSRALTVCTAGKTCTTKGPKIAAKAGTTRKLGSVRPTAYYVPKGYGSVTSKTASGLPRTTWGPAWVKVAKGRTTTVKLVRESETRKLFGSTRSGLPWASGAWVGGRFDTPSINAFGTWRGRPMDLVTTYSPRDSYATMANNSWTIDTWAGFQGRLNYGLALLPDSGEGSLASIARGDQDWVWRAVAANLQRAGRGNAIVRIGWEANLPDWRWGVGQSDAATYRAAFRRVATVLKAADPDLLIDFNVGCGVGMNGTDDRLAPLTQLYPGDDVTDIVSCDVYDWWTTRVTATSAAGLRKPLYGPGLDDLARFARAHHIAMGIGEWGLARASNGGGGGDNLHFIAAMFDWAKNNTDVFAYECYFDEPDSYLQSSLTSGGQNRKAAAMYRKLF